MGTARGEHERAVSEYRSFRITGQVQGVGFRWWARRQARDLGLQGVVRNCPDGAVEVHAHGPAETVERFRRLLQQGPPGALVARLEEIAPPGQPLPDSFEIVP
ncbi:MAG: acylphosphatase [Gemmatimonadetes bacterium]|nr:acylphosphatase [Gemmatimonadota bacterium]